MTALAGGARRPRILDEFGTSRCTFRRTNSGCQIAATPNLGRSELLSTRRFNLAHSLSQMFLAFDVRTEVEYSKLFEELVGFSAIAADVVEETFLGSNSLWTFQTSTRDSNIK